MRAGILLLISSTASAAPLAHIEQDVDGDGSVDRITVDNTGVAIALGDGSKASISLRPSLSAAVIRAAVVNGVPTVAVATTNGTGEETIVLERHGTWTAVLREMTGALGDGDYSVVIAPTVNGLYRYQARAGFRRCDGKPAYLFAEGYKDKRWRRLAKLPIDVADTAPVISAKVDGAPAAVPLEFQARVASYEPGAQSAIDLAIPVELDDGKPATYWREDLSTIGEGQFFTFEPRAATAKATQVRVQAAAAKSVERVKRIAIVGANAAFHVELADTDAAQTIDLPQPIEGCVSVVIESSFGHGSLAIGELSVYGEGERTGGGEAALAKVIANGGDVKSATQALARRGAAATAALDAELQHAKSIASRARLVRALGQMPDKSAGPLLAHAIAQNQVEDRDLDEVVAALGKMGFATELHDLITSKSVPPAHRAATVAALAQIGNPALLIDLAGEGERDQRRAVIDGLAHAPVAMLTDAAKAATSAEAAGDLWRAVTRAARTRPTEASAALAAEVTALATATDYERRYRLIDGIASLGDATALDALAKLLASLPQGSERGAFDQVAANAIAKAPRPEALNLLLAFVREADAGARYAALTALGAAEGGVAGPWHAAVHADGVDRVIQSALASDTWPEVRARAAQMLGARCSRSGPAKSLDDSVHRDPELSVRNDALSALVECHSNLAADLLAKTWDNRKQPVELRQHAIDLASELGDPALAKVLVGKFNQWRGASLESTEALALTQNAAYAIGRLAPPGAADALVGALDDGAFPEIVAAAATGLGLLGTSCPAAARTKLRALAHSEDQNVQLAANHAAALCGK